MHSQWAPPSLSLILAAFAIGAGILFVWVQRRNRPFAVLHDPIPFVFNTYQFIFNNKRFLDRAEAALKQSRIVKFYLFNTPVFLISGQRNIQALFARSHKVGSEAIFEQNVFPNLYEMRPKDVQGFKEDRSGRGRAPAPGFEDMPENKRFWHGYDRVHSDFLSKSQYLVPIAEAFTKRMEETLDNVFPLDEWKEVSLVEFCRQQVARCAIEALYGTRIFELNPDLLEAFWDFDSNIFVLTLGLPKWLFRKSYRAKDRFYSMMRKYRSATDPIDDDNIHGELARWCKDSEFGNDTEVGALAMLMFALISNTIPTTMWTILEIVKDRALLQTVREEVVNACVTTDIDGNETFHIEKVTSLPLLQSVFTEILRLHMNFNLMRNVNEEIVLDGIIFQPGSMLQAPMRIAHFEEAVWGHPGHPATEFWAERHIAPDKGGENTRSFSMAGRPSSYYPFGGGHPICPGRHVAKHEVLKTIALLLYKFDIEMVGWTKTDGFKSDRPALDDQRSSGAGAMPPDRDLKMRWKRTR